MRRTFTTSLFAAAVSVALVSPAAAQEMEPPAPEAPEAPETERRTIALAPPAARTGYLGVQLRDVDEEVVERLGLPQERGALVVAVSDGSPAARAGLQEDDIIFEWNGEDVESVAELTRLVRETPAGREVGFRVFREGASRDLRVEVGEREGPARLFRGPEASSAIPWDEERAERMRERMERVREETERARERAGRAMERMRERHGDMEHMRVVVSGAGRMGVRLQSLTSQLADHFGVEEGGGALVASVREGTPAAAAGLTAGDVIVSIAGERVESPRDVMRAVRSAEAGPLEVTVVRDGSERSLTVELPEPAEPEGNGPIGGELEIEVDLDRELAPRLEALGEELGALGARLGEAFGEELDVSAERLEELLRDLPRLRFEVEADV